MGFEKDISRVVSALDERGCQRQTILLSATLSAGLQLILFSNTLQPVTTASCHMSYMMHAHWNLT